MSEAPRTQTEESPIQEAAPESRKWVIWRMIRSSANDNLMPTALWFAWLVFWTIMVGGLLAWVIL